MVILGHTIHWESLRISRCSLCEYYSVPCPSLGITPLHHLPVAGLATMTHPVVTIGLLLNAKHWPLCRRTDLVDKPKTMGLENSGKVYVYFVLGLILTMNIFTL